MIMTDVYQLVFMVSVSLLCKKTLHMPKLTIQNCSLAYTFFLYVLPSVL